MPTLLCMRPSADEVDFKDTRFIVCKSIGVNAGGRRFAMGEELPAGTLNERALREIYDTPLRLIETFEYALQDEQLMNAMMAQMPPVDPDDEEEEEPVAAVSAVAQSIPDVPRPNKNKKRQR